MSGRERMSRLALVTFWIGVLLGMGACEPRRVCVSVRQYEQVVATGQRCLDLAQRCIDYVEFHHVSGAAVDGGGR